MLDALSDKFEKILKKLRGQGVLTEQNIGEALKEVRLALLEADVNFKIVKDFIERVRVKAVGQEVLQSLTPGHQVVKVVWDELCDMMGREKAGLALHSQPPTVVMMVGLQGAGKTTTCGKLARLFKGQGKRVLLVAADPRRPAAGDQLSSLGRDLGIDVYRVDNAQATQADVVRICRAGVERGREQGFDLVILDTGGRLHIDDELMGELVAVKTAVINKRAGGMGLISGRKAFQRPMAEGIGLLNAARNLVVIASHDRVRFEGTNEIDDLVRLRAVADEIAKNEQAVEALRAGVGKDRFEGIHVRVDIADYQVAHVRS